MATQIRWRSVCQWCGKQGSTAYAPEGRLPSNNPSVPGKCKSHPSGNPNAEHGPKWQQG